MTGPWRGTRWKPRSAFRCDEDVYLLWLSEYHVRPVTHHAGSDQRGGAFLWAVLPAIGFETKVAFPVGVRLAVVSRYAIRVGAIGDRSDPVLGIELLEIRYGATAHHSHHPPLALLCGLRRCRAGLGCFLQEGHEVGTRPGFFDARKRH